MLRCDGREKEQKRTHRRGESVTETPPTEQKKKKTKMRAYNVNQFAHPVAARLRASKTDISDSLISFPPPVPLLRFVIAHEWNRKTEGVKLGGIKLPSPSHGKRPKWICLKEI